MMWPFRSVSSPTQSAYDVALKHFGRTQIAGLTILERTFPVRIRPDLQLAIDAVLREFQIQHFCGVQAQYHEPASLSNCLTKTDEHVRLRCTPPQYQEVDVGDELPVRCLNTGLWMLNSGTHKLALLLSPASRYGETTGLRVEMAGLDSAPTHQVVAGVFRRIESAINQSSSYRGKILSLEQSEHDYRGRQAGIRVHRLRSVSREEIILPAKTLTLLDRNVIGFMKQRENLREKRLSTRKGILFYGPPGTGKTHCIHYLTRAIPGMTTLLITAEQVGLLEEYMTLARLLQPSIVVIEDADLIARDREQIGSACGEALLNKLLNQMDGLNEDSEVLFILTTNRPETLESALAGRPGRIDQAIEFPLPDASGRRQLASMYAGGVTVVDSLLDEIVRKTHGMSAAFMKELMRRSFQFQLERHGQGDLSLADVDAAIEEMLFTGGELNCKLLGASSQAIGFQQ